jgi:hypothetical protein
VAADAKSYKAQASLNALMGQGRKQTASLKGGLTFGITTGAYARAGGDAEAGFETGTSIFDPVLTELAIRWFCPPSGTVLDFCAGGSVRGIVSVMLGRRYVGVDLSARQVAANREQADTICNGNKPEWRVGDSTRIDEIAGDVRADMLLTCPPYGDLERYSDDPADVSTMDYGQFLDHFRIMVAKSLALLKDDRFAFIIVGDFRDKDGYLRNFPGDTVAAFLDAGARLYNEMILETSVGSLPIRAGRAFASNRKIGKTHQNCYLFVKGNWKRAAEACGSADDL